jgi:hypothetical protein
MSFWIDHYTGDQKPGAAIGGTSFQDAMKIAREGLLRHSARFAKVVDPSKVPAKVHIVRRDVLPQKFSAAFMRRGFRCAWPNTLRTQLPLYMQIRISIF